MARRRQLRCYGEGFVPCRIGLCGEFLYDIVVMFYFVQLPFIGLLDINQGVDVLNIVFALQGINAVQPVINPCEFGGVIVQRVHNASHALGDISQLDECITNPGRHAFNLHQVALGLIKPLGDNSQAGKNAVVLAVKVVFNTPQSLFEFGDVAQFALQCLQFLIFIGLQLHALQLVELETDVVFVEAHLLNGLAHLIEQACRFTEGLVLMPILVQQCGIAGDVVEDGQLECRLGQQHVTVLRMDIEQPGAQVAQHRQRHRGIVDEGT